MLMFGYLIGCGLLTLLAMWLESWALMHVVVALLGFSPFALMSYNAGIREGLDESLREANVKLADPDLRCTYKGQPTTLTVGPLSDAQ